MLYSFEDIVCINKMFFIAQPRIQDLSLTLFIPASRDDHAVVAIFVR